MSNATEPNLTWIEDYQYLSDQTCVDDSKKLSRSWSNHKARAPGIPSPLVL